MLSRIISNILFLSLTIFSFAQCKTVENNTSQNKSSSKPITSIGDSMKTIKLNGDKSMELHIKKNTKPGDPATHFEYIVYEVNTKNILKQGSYRGTHIDWNDNTSLKLIPYIGMEQKPISDNPEDEFISNTQKQITIIKLKNSK